MSNESRAALRPPAVEALKVELARRNIALEYFDTGAEARDWVLSKIPQGATVMNGGSTTLEQIGLFDALKNGPYEFLRPRVAAENHPVERVRARRKASIADFVVGGINAITASGEILNADGAGNRIASYSYGAGKLFLVAGMNKLVPDMNAAFERLRNVAAVEECKEIGAQTPCALTGRCDNAACRGPQRQCGKVLIIENEKIAGRITVVMIGQPLGY